MKIKSVQIENFRAIRSFSGELGNSINVLFGENGVGKSSFVLVLNYLLSWLTARILNPKGNGRVLTDEDITIGEKYCRLCVILEDDTQWILYRQRSTERSKAPQSDLHALSRWADEWVTNHIDKEGMLIELPTLGIYDVNRSVVDVPQRLVHQQLTPSAVYQAKSTDFKTFFHWFREREDVENELLREAFDKDRSITNFQPDSQLEAVRKAIAKILPQYGKLHVRRHPRKFVMEKNDVEYDFARMSDGEKCYITLVASIARRLAVTHPSSKCPLEESGVFVIDEIDLHLHPDWQRLVVDKLRSTFPNVQFILTTHSPAVLSSVRTYAGEKVFSVADGRINPIDAKVFGQSIDNILLRDFAVPSIRSVEAEILLDHVRNALQKGDINSPEYIVAKKEMLQKLDPSDIEVASLLLEEVNMKKKQLQ